MRVIEQARLGFREGTSDKVYEVDLIELAPNQHVVNFRFGRRGTVLRDGTKTATPVDLARARTIFGKLVAEKTAGGYRPVAPAAPAASPTPPPPAPPPAAADPDAALLARLRRGVRGDDALGPHVWRAADRDLRTAEPALLELLDASGPRSINAIAWKHTLISALARCGTAASLDKLTQLADDAGQKPHVRDVARLAIVRIDPSRAAGLARAGLNKQLRDALDARDADALTRAAEELLETSPVVARAAAISLYLLDTAELPAASAGDPYRGALAVTERPGTAGLGLTRRAILAIARVARLTNLEAIVVRALFRLAELRRDGELYARLAKRIDASTNPVRPFGPATREYLRRRVARVLRRLGRTGSPDYVPMASALLLSFTDDDARPPRVGASAEHYDQFARLHAFNDVLYGGASPRYERAHHRRSAWRCKGRHRPGDPAPAVREERWPAVWDRAPAALWRVMIDSRCQPVIEFAARALGDHRAYLDTLSDSVLADVLAGGHPLAQHRAFSALRGRAMTTQLARAALASELPDAHSWVLGWIADRPGSVAGDPELLALLITGKTGAIRDAGLAILRGHAVADDVARSAAIRALAILLGLADTEADAARAAGAVAVLLRGLEAPLTRISADVLRDLIGHPLAALGELAGELMLRHAARDQLPAELIQALLTSPHPTVRALGGRLVAATPIEIAKDDLDALYLFATSDNRELRDATRRLLGELATRYPDVARALADRLIDALLTPLPSGAPAHVVSLLAHELAAILPAKPATTILRLIGALSPHARDAGALLLPQVSPDDIGLDDITRLASHELLAVRHAAWTLARAAAARFRLAPVAVAKLVDSGWDDTRAFAQRFLTDELSPLSADAIIAICDSIRPEVQALGRELLVAQFRGDDAGRYVVRLAEHPSPSIQLLVSTLLDHHVAGQLDRLRTVAPYLVTVLSQVNRGKVAKARVIELLRREATASAEAAAIIAPILDRQSATSAITQKHPLIATMVELHHQFPDVALPITIVAPPSISPGAPGAPASTDDEAAR